MSKFKSRLQAYGTAKRVWTCRTCGCEHVAKKPVLCDVCTHKTFYYFMSKKEAKRYKELKLMVSGGLITQLELQPKFTLDVNKVQICTYTADFSYRDQKQRLIVEDVKATMKQKGWSDLFIMKKKMFEAQYEMPVSIVA